MVEIGHLDVGRLCHWFSLWHGLLMGGVRSSCPVPLLVLGPGGSSMSVCLLAVWLSSNPSSPYPQVGSGKGGSVTAAGKSPFLQPLPILRQCLLPIERTASSSGQVKVSLPMPIDWQSNAPIDRRGMVPADGRHLVLLPTDRWHPVPMPTDGQLLWPVGAEDDIGSFQQMMGSLSILNQML